jgi:hypothetical protein
MKESNKEIKDMYDLSLLLLLKKAPHHSLTLIMLQKQSKALIIIQNPYNGSSSLTLPTRALFIQVDLTVVLNSSQVFFVKELELVPATH